MSDNLGPLRQAMSDLAEHGSQTDMYERAVRKSHHLKRRTTVATSAAAAAAVFALAATIATVTTRQAPPPPLATGTPPPTPTPTSAAPSTSPATTAPTSPPTSAVPSTTTPSSAPRTSNRPQYPDCPSAKTLEALADLPKGWHFAPSTVDCWRTWATADPVGPTPGDGFYLFHYKSTTGWRYHSQGSGYNCADLGITSGNPPFCQLD